MRGVPPKEWTWTHQGRVCGVQVAGDHLHWFEEPAGEPYAPGGRKKDQDLEDFALNGPARRCPDDVLREIMAHVQLATIGWKAS